MLKTYAKLGIPLKEQALLAGVMPAEGEEPARNIAVDAVFDSVSVATTFRKSLYEAGVIFCPISEAVHDYPELVRQYLGTVVPGRGQLFRRAEQRRLHRWLVRVHPKGVRCPMELSTYFRINARIPVSSSGR